MVLCFKKKRLSHYQSICSMCETDYLIMGGELSSYIVDYILIIGAFDVCLKLII